MFFFPGVGGSVGSIAVQPAHTGADANTRDVRGSSNGTLRRRRVRQGAAAVLGGYGPHIHVWGPFCGPRFQLYEFMTSPKGHPGTAVTSVVGTTVVADGTTGVF